MFRLGSLNVYLSLSSVRFSDPILSLACFVLEEFELKHFSNKRVLAC